VLKRATFSTASLIAAGFDVSALKDAGCSALELKQSGCDASTLKKCGFNAADLKRAEFPASSLKAAGYDAASLKAAGYSATDLKKADFALIALKTAGYDIPSLKCASYDTTALRLVGFSIRDFVAAGHQNFDELMSAGFDREALRAVGLVDRPCPNGHQLQVVTGKPSAYSGWICDLCRKGIPHDSSGVLHCSACKFDLCRGCQAQDWRCPKGHALICQHGKPSSYAGWSCDGCKKTIPHETKGVLHCKTCNYDLCQSCRKDKEGNRAGFPVSCGKGNCSHIKCAAFFNMRFLKS